MRAVTTETVGPKYMTLADAERYSGMSISSLRRLVARAALKAHRPTGKILLSVSELDDFIQRSANVTETAVAG